MIAASGMSVAANTHCLSRFCVRRIQLYSLGGSNDTFVKPVAKVVFALFIVRW